MGLNKVEHFPKYVLTPDTDDDFISFHTYLSGIRDNLDELNDNFHYLRFALGAEPGGKVYIYPAMDDVNITIGYYDYAISDILDDDFFVNYTDNSEIFENDYDEAVEYINDDIKKANSLLRQFALDWGFKEEKSVAESYGKPDKITLEYDDIRVNFEYHFHNSWHEYDKEEAYTYQADKDDVKEALIEDILVGIPEFDNMSDEELSDYVEKNINDLVDKYYDQLLEHFRRRATEEANEYIQDNFDPEEWGEDY